VFSLDVDSCLIFCSLDVFSLDVDSCPLSNMMTSILQDNVVSCILCSTYTSAVDRRLQVEIACNRRIIWFQRGNHILLVYCALLELHEALKCIK